FTIMPPGGSAARRDALAEMSVLAHQNLTHKKLGDLLGAAAPEHQKNVARAKTVNYKKIPAPPTHAEIWYCGVGG
ncbi:hypothetical protein ACVGV5_09765, partial [Enterobacter sichuanensis]